MQAAQGAVTDGWGAGYYVVLAAVCLRLAGAVQDSHVGGAVGLTPGAGSAFSVRWSVLPLIFLWYLCRSARFYSSGVGGSSGSSEWSSSQARGRVMSVAQFCWRSIARGASGGRIARGLNDGFEEGGEGGRGRGEWLSPPRRPLPSSTLSLPRRRFAVHGLLQAVSLVAVAGYWANAALTPSTEARSHSNDADINSRPAGAVDAAETGAAAGTGTGGAGSSPLDDMLEPLLSIPIRLLLPRITYALCVAGLVMTVWWPSADRELHTEWGKRQRRLPALVDSPNHSAHGSVGLASGGGGYGTYPGVSARAAATVITHLLPVVVLLLGPGSPPVVVLVAMSCGFVLKGISLAASAPATSAAVGGPLSLGAALPLGAVAVAWAIVGRACFFLTGHHNQFSRLQYSAGFVGVCGGDYFGWNVFRRRVVRCASGDPISDTKMSGSTGEEI